jgi:hypothetical protein
MMMIMMMELFAACYKREDVWFPLRLLLLDIEQSRSDGAVWDGSLGMQVGMSDSSEESRHASSVLLCCGVMRDEACHRLAFKTTL